MVGLLTSPLRPGENVRVRSWNEIRLTLDARGCLDALPFMPEMLPCCGHQYQVWRRVEKTCVEGDGVRRMQSVVLLAGVRCDGSTHGGCEKECTIFWHEAWLHRSDGSGSPDIPGHGQNNPDFPYPTGHGDGRYMCQSTELLEATCPLSKVDPRQYWRDLASRTWTLRQMLRFATIAAWLRVKAVCFGISSVRLRGNQTKTPVSELGLQPGEWTQVKDRHEIRATLDRQGRNRGLEFPIYMVPFCGRRFRVKKRVNRIVLETSGEMREIRNTVMLEGVTCDGYGRWGGCPRDSYHLWREIWLKRIET